MIVSKYFQNVFIKSIAIFILCDFSIQYENVLKNNKINLTQNYFKNFINQNNRESDVSYLLSNKLNDFLDLNDGSVSDINNTLNTTLSEPYGSILRELFENRNTSDQNDTTSESRTLSSWLGLSKFRRPLLKTKPNVRIQSQRPLQQRFRPIIGPPFIPNFMPRPDGFPGPTDPDSFLIPPSLFEDSGIKYWLKFIENGGNDDRPTLIEHELRPIVNRGYSRPRRPANYPTSSSFKPIEIGEKPSDDEDLYHENDENNSSNDEPNSSNSQNPSSHESQKFDTTPRCDKFTSDICVDDFEYPEQAIVDEIYKRREIFELMYSEVRDNTPLVDGIPRDVEESYSYDYYYNDNKDSQTSSSEKGNPEEKSSPGAGFVCPSEVLYGKPKLARNKKGEWKVIVNAAEFTQTVRMEKCLKPNSKCNYISFNDFESRCAQVHSFHRLLVFEKGKGFYIDTFRIPTACTCHVNRKVTFKPIASATASDNYENKQKPSPALSNTLWSILGGNLHNTGSGSLSQSQDLIRNQINLLQQMKHFPQLSHISPENVIQQLMDIQSNAQSLAVPQKAFQNLQNSASMSFKHQSVPSLGQSGLDYILPAIMVNEEPNNHQQVQRQRLRPLAQVHQTPETMTYLNPNTNGAPVVQVILPVASSIASNEDPAPVYKPPRHRNPSFSDYSYLDASSLFSRKKPIPTEIFSDELPFNEDSFRPLLLQMSSKTNSSLMSPLEKDEYEKESESESSISMSKNMSDSEVEIAKKRKGIIQSTMNKKINFSYHPILEYISN
jgi:hypothetical protein